MLGEGVVVSSAVLGLERTVFENADVELEPESSGIGLVKVVPGSDTESASELAPILALRLSLGSLVEVDEGGMVSGVSERSSELLLGGVEDSFELLDSGFVDVASRPVVSPVVVASSERVVCGLEEG